MAYIHFAAKDITFKIAVIGAKGSGKSTFLQALRTRLEHPDQTRFKPLATASRPKVMAESYLEQLLIDLGFVAGFNLKVSIFGLSLECPHPSLHLLKLQNLDGLIRLVSNRVQELPAQIEALESYDELFADYRMTAANLPNALYFNSFADPDAATQSLPEALLNQYLNPNNAPFFAGNAANLDNVEPCFRAVVETVLMQLAERRRQDATDAL